MENELVKGWAKTESLMIQHTKKSYSKCLKILGSGKCSIFYAVVVVVVPNGNPAPRPLPVVRDGVLPVGGGRKVDGPTTPGGGGDTAGVLLGQHLTGRRRGYQPLAG